MDYFSNNVLWSILIMHCFISLSGKAKREGYRSCHNGDRNNYNWSNCWQIMQNGSLFRQGRLQYHIYYVFMYIIVIEKFCGANIILTECLSTLYKYLIKIMYHQSYMTANNKMVCFWSCDILGYQSFLLDLINFTIYYIYSIYEWSKWKTYFPFSISSIY